MVIQCERIWLFETTLSDPYIFDKTDGIDVLMSPDNDQNIQLLDIDKAVFFIDTVLKGGLTKELGYGGEDTRPLTTNGKVSATYSLAFNIPLDDDDIIDQLVGKEFSIVCMRRNFSLFSIFGRFESKKLEIDNEILQRITFETELGNHIVYELGSLNVTEVINIIGNPPPIYPPEFIDTEAFDYIVESAIN